MSPQDVLEVRIITGTTLISLKSLVMIRTLNRHSQITLLDNAGIEVFHDLKWFEMELPKQIFFRCHKSYIVNCNYFESINLSACKIRLKNGCEIPLSRRRKQELLDCIKECIIWKDYVEGLKFVTNSTTSGLNIP